jgi:hypothetical protein
LRLLVQEHGAGVSLQVESLPISLWLLVAALAAMVRLDHGRVAAVARVVIEN